MSFLIMIILKKTSNLILESYLSFRIIAFSLFTLTFFSLAEGSFVSEANKLVSNKIKYDGLPEIVGSLAGI